MNFEQLKEKILEAGYEEIADSYDVDSPAELRKSLNLTIVHSEGGYEEGSEVVRILKHTSEDGDIYVKLTGWYSSYEGVDWSYDIVQVYPKEVVSVEYVENN